MLNQTPQKELRMGEWRYNSRLDGSELLAAYPDRLSPGETAPKSLVQEPTLQNWCGHRRGEKYVLSRWKQNPDSPVVQLVAYTLHRLSYPLTDISI